MELVPFAAHWPPEPDNEAKYIGMVLWLQLLVDTSA
jgi:hypothetical protein